MSPLAPPPRSRILVIEDEPEFAQMIAGNFQIEGYDVVTAVDGLPGLELHEAHPVDLILLDLMLPTMDGFQVLEALRARGDQVPVLMLTARGEERAKIRGFELGADDYVTKPFSILELLSRVRAVLRRVNPPQAERGTRFLKSGPFELDRDRLEVRRETQTLDIGDQGFRLLETLILRSPHVVRRSELLALAWEETNRPGLRTVDAHISRIRKTLGPDKEWLTTVGGAGYRWLGPASSH